MNSATESATGFAIEALYATEPAAPVSTWQDAMDTGNTRIDGLHHEMVDLLNELAASESQSVDGVREVLGRLIAHTHDHFALEELWMARLNYPAAGCHLGEHQQVYGVMLQVLDALDAGQAEYAFVLARELGQWLPIHVASMDRALTDFISTTGADVDVG